MQSPAPVQPPGAAAVELDALGLSPLQPSAPPRLETLAAGPSLLAVAARAAEGRSSPQVANGREDLQHAAPGCDAAQIPVSGSEGNTDSSPSAAPAHEAADGHAAAHPPPLLTPCLPADPSLSAWRPPHLVARPGGSVVAPHPRHPPHRAAYWTLGAPGNSPRAAQRMSLGEVCALHRELAGGLGVTASLDDAVPPAPSPWAPPGADEWYGAHRAPPRARTIPHPGPGRSDILTEWLRHLQPPSEHGTPAAESCPLKPSLPATDPDPSVPTPAGSAPPVLDHTVGPGPGPCYGAGAAQCGPPGVPAHCPLEEAADPSAAPTPATAGRRPSLRPPVAPIAQSSRQPPPRPPPPPADPSAAEHRSLHSYLSADYSGWTPAWDKAPAAARAPPAAPLDCVTDGPTEADIAAASAAAVREVLRGAWAANLVEYIADNVLGMMVAGSFRELVTNLVPFFDQLGLLPAELVPLGIVRIGSAVFFGATIVLLQAALCRRLQRLWGEEAAQRLFFILLWPGRPETVAFTLAATAELHTLLGHPCGAACCGAVTCVALCVIALAVAVGKYTYSHVSAATGGSVAFAARTAQLYTLTFAGRMSYNAWTSIVASVSETQPSFDSPGNYAQLTRRGCVHLFLSLAGPLFFLAVLRRRPGDTASDIVMVDTLQFVVLFGWGQDHVDFTWEVARHMAGGPRGALGSGSYGLAGAAPPTPWPMVLYLLLLLGAAALAARLRSDRAFAPTEGPWWVATMWLMWALQFVAMETWAGWATMQSFAFQVMLCAAVTSWQLGLYEVTTRLRESVAPPEEPAKVPGQLPGEGPTNAQGTPLDHLPRSAPDWINATPFRRRLSGTDWAPHSYYGALSLAGSHLAAPLPVPASRAPGAASAVAPPTPMLPVCSSSVFSAGQPWRGGSPAPTLATMHYAGLAAQALGAAGPRGTPEMPSAGAVPAETVELVPCPPSVSLTCSVLARAAATPSVTFSHNPAPPGPLRWAGNGYFASGICGSLGPLMEQRQAVSPQGSGIVGTEVFT